MQQFFANGYLWVDLFFVLSGFVLAYGQASMFSGAYRLRTHLRFLALRIARVYPLYAVVIVESACLLAWRSGHLNGYVLGCNLAMVQGWGLAGSLEGAAWSVSTEWAAYLLFPVLLGVTVLASRRVAFGAALAAGGGLVWLALSPGPFVLPGQARQGPLDLYSAATAAPLARCLTEFTFGLLAFRAGRWLAAADGAGAWLCRCSGGVSLPVALLLVSLLCLPGFDLAVVALFWVLLVLLFQQSGALAAALGTAAPYQLGRWSYAIYLIHDKFSHPMAMLNGMLAGRVPFASLLSTVIVSAAVIACSALTFHWVEQPLRRSVMALLTPVRERGIAQLPASATGLGAGT